MDKFSLIILLLAIIWVAIGSIRSSDRDKANHQEHIKMVKEAIALVKRAIELERLGLTVAAKSDAERLQEQRQNALLEPKKGPQQELKRQAEIFERVMEDRKQHRIKDFKSSLEQLAQALSALFTNNKLGSDENYRTVRVIAQKATRSATQQIDDEDIESFES